MKHLLRFISSAMWLLLVAGGVLVAQPQDSTVSDVDSLGVALPDSVTLAPPVHYPLFRTASLAIDYGKLLGHLSGVEQKKELGIQLNLKKSWFVIAEGGYSVLMPNDSYVNANYEVDGSYVRVGAGWTKALDPKNNFTFSMRYGTATFNDKGTVRISSASDLFEPYDSSFARSSMQASWYELVLGSEKRILPKNADDPTRLYAGFYFRLRVMIDYDKQSPHDVFTIPGYGRTFDSTVPALNLYLRYLLFTR
jgi:hypothetical protein